MQSIIIITMKKVVTHNSGFHSDDVFAIAVLQIVFGKENLEIKRTRDKEIIEAADIVVDVGAIYSPKEGRFDHHQNGAPMRSNGIPYAAIGLVWKEFGEQITTAYAAQKIDERVVMPLDAGDNGVSTYNVTESGVAPVLLQSVIDSFLPVSEKAEEAFYEGFINAVDFAREYLMRSVAYYEADEHEYEKARALYSSSEDKQLLVSDEPINKDHLIDFPEVKILVSPQAGSKDDWRSYTIRESRNSFTGRAVFPEKWRGLRDSELVEVSGIASAKFCHRAGFLFVASEKAGALEAAKAALG